HWRELFYRWFLSMTAHWRGLDRQHGNSTSPLLVGAQGYQKSTFCRILLPPELRFGYTDSIDFKSKQDAERSLGRFFLINIDEFDQISVSQQGFLKHLLQ
ncbi:VapE family protein, partial [Bacteroides cellulosilyticus]